jgi:hypothetical protein
MKESYKHIHNGHKYVIITHYLLYEYENEFATNNTDTSYKKYRKNILSSYNLAHQLNYCEIIDNNNEFIKIKMKKYEMLNNKISFFDSNKLYELLENMYENKIIHLDFSPEIIGIDKYNDYTITKLDKLYNFIKKEIFISWLIVNENEFKRFGLGKKYNTVCQKIIESINL